MSQLEHIEAIEKQLWGAADNLRANSNFASNEYFMPVMGLIFLRHAYSRFLEAKTTIVVPTRGGKARSLTKEDFSQHGAILLREKAQFDFLVELPDSEDRATAIIQAMESIESDYDNLQGLLPKGEYQELDNEVLGQLLRTLNPDELKQVSGDVFGRIYEYFLTQFADQKAHDGGEFFTPISLVSFMANVLDPKAGTVLDPACGSGGMFVQSARIVERQGLNPTEKLTFKGLEKNATTLRLAKMNLAVHGLDGDIERAITYYEDPHQLVGQADYVMANPPFNVDAKLTLVNSVTVTGSSVTVISIRLCTSTPSKNPLTYTNPLPTARMMFLASPDNPTPTTSLFSTSSFKVPKSSR